MSKRNKHNTPSMHPDRHDHSLRLAVAAASLGMSMGISPAQVLATSQQPDQLPDDTSINPAEPMRLAAEFMKFDGIDGEAVDERKAGNKGVESEIKSGHTPGAVFPKIDNTKAEGPPGQMHKIVRPDAVFPKVEQPAVGHHKIQRPASETYKLDRPTGEYLKVEKPAATQLKVELPAAADANRDAQPEAAFPKLETPVK